MEFGYLKLLHIDFVFANQLPKSPPLFLCCLRSPGYVSFVGNQKILDIVCFELQRLRSPSFPEMTIAPND